jgi:hypothetical protein
MTAKKKRAPDDAGKLREDANEAAFRTLQEVLGERPKIGLGRGEKNPIAQERGATGGRKGGKARAASLTPEQRREIAKKAAAARWTDK